MTDDVLPAALAEELRRVLGSPTGATRRLPRANQGSVWRVLVGAGEPVVVKCPHDRATLHAEVLAYQRWGVALAPWIPRLRAVLPTALVLDWVGGELGDDVSLSDADRGALHDQAGQFQRALDRLPFVDPDPMPVSQALQLRLERWSDRARAYLPAKTLQAVRRRFDPTVFTGSTRRPSHRDFSPWNWLLVRDPAPRLVVLDFGQSRPDVWLNDLVKLCDRPWLEHPETRDAFFRGYGRALSLDEAQQLEHLLVLHGLATAVWGREHDAPDYAEHGVAVLRRQLQ